MIAANRSIGDVYRVSIRVSRRVGPPAEKIHTAFEIAAIHGGGVIVGVALCCHSSCCIRIAVKIAAIDGDAVIGRSIAASGKTSVDAGCLICLAGIDKGTIVYDNAVACRGTIIGIAAIKPIGISAAAAHRICPTVDDQRIVGRSSILCISKVERIAIVLIRNILIQCQVHTGNISGVACISLSVDILCLGHSPENQPTADSKGQCLFGARRTSIILFHFTLPLIRVFSIPKVLVATYVRIFLHFYIKSFYKNQMFIRLCSKIHLFI